VCSQNGSAVGRHGGSGRHRHRPELLRVHPNGGLGDGLCARKRALRYSSHCAIHVAVHISRVVDGGYIVVIVDDGGVVNVRDRGLINVRIANVHAVYVRGTYTIRRNVNFARTEREPSDRRAGSHAATHKHNQSGRIDGTHFARTRDPAPAVTDISPAAIVEGRVSPRIVIYPSPAPRINPCPVASVIRSPSGRHARKPCIPVIGSGTPVAVFIKILKADYAAVAVASRGRILISALTTIRPVVEIIGPPDLIHFCVQRISTGEGKALARMYGVALTVACRFTFALANRYHGGVAVFGSVHTVTAGTSDGEGLIGGINFEYVVAIQIPNAHVHASGTELDLNSAVVEIQESDAGVSAQIDRGRAQLEFRARIAVGP
jgi:hypothetical protein